MCLACSEDAYWPPWFLAIIVQIRIMRSAIIMESECLTKVRKTYLMFWLGINGERVLGDITLQFWQEHLLQCPNAWVVVSRVLLLVTRISLMEIELSLFWVIESVLFGKLYEIIRGEVVSFIFRIIIPEPTLIT